MVDESEEPTPDDICGKYFDLGVKIQVTDLDDEYVLFEGSKEGLEFLAKLFWAQAQDFERDSNNLSPFSAGNALFTRKSARGIYIRRIDPDTKGFVIKSPCKPARSEAGISVSSINDESEEPTPDDICCKYVDLGVRIQVTDLDEYVLFEGTQEGLEFLAELFWAQAHDPERDSKHISPENPGSLLFTKKSTRGIYIRRIDPD